MLVINRGAASVDSVSVTLNGQRPSTEVFNTMNTMPHQQQTLLGVLGGISPYQAGIGNTVVQYPFQGMNESNARRMQTQNSVWQGICNPVFNPFLMAAQTGIQPFVTGMVPSNQSNTDVNRGEPVNVTSVQIVTRQPTSTLTRTTAPSARTRPTQPSRSVQSSRRTPPAAFSDPYDHDGEQSCSLRFGGVGVGRSDVDPIICMPNDIWPCVVSWVP